MRLVELIKIHHWNQKGTSIFQHPQWTFTPLTHFTIVWTKENIDSLSTNRQKYEVTWTDRDLVHWSVWPLWSHVFGHECCKVFYVTLYKLGM